MRRPSHTEGSGYQSMAWSIPPLSGYKLNTLGMQQTYLKLMYKEVIIIEMHQNNTTLQVGLTVRQSLVRGKVMLGGCWWCETTTKVYYSRFYNGRKARHWQ